MNRLSGTSLVTNVATMKCAAITCPFITLENIDIRNATSGAQLTRYSCSNVRNITGFSCA